MEKEERFILVEGESYAQALEKGLEQLQLTEDQVSVELVEEKRGFLFKKATVTLRLTPAAPAVQQSEDLPEGLREISGLAPSFGGKNGVKPYRLQFQPDGIYLTVTDLQTDEVRLKEEITALFRRKQVSDYDGALVTEALTHRNQPQKVAPAQEEVLLDSEISVKIERNKMTASLRLIAPEGGRAATAADLLEALNNQGVLYGIDEEKLKAIALLGSTEEYVVIAKGKPPVEGLDGRVIYHFSTDKQIKPTLLDDGTVDFKQLNLIRNVERGELLLEIVLPTPGVPGTDVTGAALPAKPGKEARFKKGKNTVENEEGTKLYSVVSGQVVIEDDKISVSEVYYVKGDVDNGTGNIRFNGSVIIQGNVKSGFSVQAEGNIEVAGVVEGATLLAKGDIILNRGIQGNNQAYLECGGNLKVKYVENARLKCQGDIFAEAMLHSDVIAKGKVVVGGKKGLIAGGDIRAGEEIRATSIGSQMGTATRLEVGVDPEERMKLEQLKTEVQETDRNAQNLKKTIELLTRVAQNGQMPKTKEEILVKSVKTHEFLKEKQAKLRAEMQLLEEKINALSQGKIHVAETIYPGVKVVISSATRFIYDELDRCTLYRKDGEVTVGPFEG